LNWTRRIPLQIDSVASDAASFIGSGRRGRDISAVALHGRNSSMDGVIIYARFNAECMPATTSSVHGYYSGLHKSDFPKLRKKAVRILNSRIFSYPSALENR
jgi:hypothetical protein